MVFSYPETKPWPYNGSFSSSMDHGTRPIVVFEEGGVLLLKAKDSTVFAFNGFDFSRHAEGV
jgi:hypothetical protein